MLDINVKDVSLVLEGGTFRTVFTMGILDAFLDEGIMMPHISGVSAGITYAGSYISQQKGRNIQILKKLYILKGLLKIILLKEVAQVQIHLDQVI